MFKKVETAFYDVYHSLNVFGGMQREQEETGQTERG